MKKYAFTLAERLMARSEHSEFGGGWSETKPLCEDFVEKSELAAIKDRANTRFRFCSDSSSRLRVKRALRRRVPLAARRAKSIGGKYSKDVAFTLAEMLIAMGIVGFVAALTIPALTSGTRQHEYKTSYRKALDTLNRAINIGTTMDNRMPGDLVTATALRDYFSGRVNVQSTGVLGSNLVFYTTDGMRFEIPSSRPTTTDRCRNTVPCLIMVDVNDAKLPNTTPADINNNIITDRFSIGITDSAAIPNGQTAINVMSKSN